MCQFCEVAKGAIKELDFSSGLITVCEKYSKGTVRLCKNCLAQVTLTKKREAFVLSTLSLDPAYGYFFMIDACEKCDLSKTVPPGGEYFRISGLQVVNRHVI